ncbi:hypothetical protein [Actinomadura hibisca]|uniref:hypothetical protein n=1 Tax=Actinomadura hibisca TaxID=68565 RepID=UPI000A029D48|nr:hypothetical protein [Actinomadura hibisca]
MPAPLLLLGGAALTALGLLLGLAVSLGWTGPAARATGRFLDFYGGVFSLVALSLAVMVGLLATDRALLSPGHRVRAQAVHRGFAFVAVATLALHLATQLARHRVGPLEALVPTGGDHLADYGLGTLACHLMVVAIGSGIVRGRFAASGRPWMWRALHLTAYLAWPVAVAHGLTSGREPAAWVTAAYLLCLAGVALALVARPFLARHAGRAR